KRSENIRGNRDRRTYLAGVMEGFREKLEADDKAHRAEGLVWVGDADLEAYYRKRHPHIRHSRTMGHLRTDAHVACRSAGRRLVVRRGGRGANPEGRRAPVLWRKKRSKEKI